MQGLDIDFRLILDFLFQGTVFFTPQWALKTNQTHETAFFLIYLVGLEDPPNHLVSKTKAFCVNVNKHSSY